MQAAPTTEPGSRSQPPPPPPPPAPSAPASGKSLATSRKVARLLDITANSGLHDLVAYVDEAVPHFFDSAGATPTPTPTHAADRTTTTTAGLRSALEGRVTDMHKDFLGQLRALHDTFQGVAQHVRELDKECASLESALGMEPKGQATGSGEAEALLRRVTALQHERERAQRRRLEVRTFREKLNFGAAEQRLLEEGPVDARYLDVLEQARAVHRRSRSLLTSREYQQSAGAVMESTYTAVMRATEKVGRFLLALSATPSGSGGGGMGGTTGMDGAGLVSCVAADVPEVSSLYLRCAHVLREENVVQWEKVMEELARVRRASVLRRYFHLLTTGSATTLAGTYRAGASTRADSAASSTALRPLEAELGDPVFFFSALLAWLHQCIVEEDDFLALFFREAPVPAVGNDTGHESVDSSRPPPPSPLTPQGRPSHTLTRRALLCLIFDGVTRHVRTALDGVLDRFVKASAVLGHTLAAGDAEAAGATREASLSGAGTTVQPRGPRGLTGSLARLLSAATGRPVGGGGYGGGIAGGGSEGLLQRYANVNTRVQQEAVAAALLRGSLGGLHVCYQLLQLFSYYGAATLMPLLGAKASLTQLVVESAQVELQRVLQQLVRFISLHLFDSIGGAVYHLPVLRRLSTAFEASRDGWGASSGGAGSGPGDSTTTTTNTPSTIAAQATGGGGTEAGSPPRRFVLDFLFRHHAVISGEALDDILAGSAELPSLAKGPSVGLAGGGTTDPQQQAAALELWRSLQSLILPVSPEVQASLAVLEQLLIDTARQQQLLVAIREQHQQQRERRRLSLGSTAGQRGVEGEEVYDDVQLEDQVDAEPPMYFMAVVQSLLGFPVLLAAQSAANAGLDDPCQATLVLNCFLALRGVLVGHEGLLRQCTPSRPDGGAAGPSAPLAIVDAEVARLETALGQHVAAAACQHYLGAARSPATLPSGAGVAPQQQQQQQHAVRTSLYWLYNFYSLMAANGALPPLPLISSVTDAAMQRRLQAHVTRRVLDEYDQTYREVQRQVQAAEAAATALLSAEETAALSDMAPEKLRILMDK